MSKGLLAAVLMICLVGLGVSLQKSFELARQYQELRQENQKQSDQIKKLRSDLLQVHKQEQTEYLSEQTTVENLRAKLKQQQDAVGLAEDRLRKDRNEGAGGREIPALRDRLSQENAVLQDLQSSLKGVQAKERDLDSQDRQNSQGYNQNQKAAEADLNAQIKTQEATLKSMNDQANRLKRMLDYSSQQQYTAIQGQIAQQKDTIQQLKAQRAGLNDEYNSAKTGTHYEVQVQRQALKNTEQDLQSQISTEKATLAQFQKDIQSGQATKKAYDDEIRSATSDLDSKRTALKVTQAQLDSEQKKLQSLAPSPPNQE